MRAVFCPDRSEIRQIRCVEDHRETEHQFGSQLWYFEGIGVDEVDRRHVIFGAIEYSLQFGLHELIDDGVFTSDVERAKIRNRLIGSPIEPLANPLHRWLLATVIAAVTAYLAYVAVYFLT